MAVLKLLVGLNQLELALGYWFGSEGKENAERRASTAQYEATQIRRQLTAVLDSSSEPDLLDKAKAKDREAFPPQAGNQES